MAASIAVASTTIGFISFAFTLFTFLRVFWSSLITMIYAPRQAQGYLDNLRSELYEERDHFRHAMRDVRSKSQSNPRHRVNCAPLGLMNDSVKGLLHKFRRLEAPFVEEKFWGEEADLEKDMNGTIAPRDAEVRHLDRGREEATINGESVYRPMDLARRYDWLRSKDDVLLLADQVTRITTRRIAFDTNNVLQALHHVERQLRDFDDRLYGLEKKVPGKELSDREVNVKREKKK